MANPEHLAWLEEGVPAWNARRKDRPFTPDLSKTLLWIRDLQGADLRGANLRGAGLNHTNLQKADLREADLSFGYLGGSLLNNADLRGANLFRTNLQTSYIDNADVRGTDLSRTQYLQKRHFSRMRGDATTKLPSRLSMPPLWLEQTDTSKRPDFPPLPLAHEIAETENGFELGRKKSELDEETLSALFEDLLDAVNDLQDFGNLDNQAPMLSKGVERFLKRLPTDLGTLDQVRFGAGVQALSLQFNAEKPVLEDVAPEKIGHLDAVLMRANLIAANLPIWIEFRKEEAETEPVFAARQEDVEAILEHAAEALENDPEHFDPSLFLRIREYLDDATMVGYLASKDLLIAIASKTFVLVKELTSDTVSEMRKQSVKNIATALNVQLGAVLMDLAGILPKQLRWLVDWLEYLPTLL